MPRRISDPYEVLGLDRNATEVDIRAAYLRLVKKHHPDKNPDDKASEWIFKQVQSAYETLCNAKGVQPSGQQRPPRAHRDHTERDQHAGPDHHSGPQQDSERAERQEHRRSRQQRPRAKGERSAGVRPEHTTRERSPADSALRRTLRWGKWTVYCSNAVLWPSALAGWLEWLPDRVGVLAFGWMGLGVWMLAWDFVLKDTIKDLVKQFRRETRKRP